MSGKSDYALLEHYVRETRKRQSIWIRRTTFLSSKEATALPATAGPPTTERSNGRGAHLAVPTFGSLMEYGANRRPTKNNGRRQTQRGRGKEEDLANGPSMVTEGYCFS